MSVFISLLRGVNVGGHNLVKMEALRAMYATLHLRDAETYVQSGNVVFRTAGRDAHRTAEPAADRTADRDSARLATRIEDAIERTFGHRPAVILRTASDLRQVVARNPFTERPGIDPRKLVVTFLPGKPAEEACAKVRALQAAPEELHLDGRELFMYFPNGMGQSKLSMAAVDRALRMSGTARNWNTVTKLLAMAEKLESVKRKSML